MFTEKFWPCTHYHDITFLMVQSVGKVIQVSNQLSQRGATKNLNLNWLIAYLCIVYGNDKTHLLGPARSATCRRLKAKTRYNKNSPLWPPVDWCLLLLSTSQIKNFYHKIYHYHQLCPWLKLSPFHTIHSKILFHSLLLCFYLAKYFDQTVDWYQPFPSNHIKCTENFCKKGEHTVGIYHFYQDDPLLYRWDLFYTLSHHL